MKGYVMFAFGLRCIKIWACECSWVGQDPDEHEEQCGREIIEIIHIHLPS